MTVWKNHTHIFNQTKTNEPDLYWQAALGHNDALQHVLKFGRNETVATDTWEDIWDYGGDYNWPSDLGSTMYISSSNALDTQQIYVQGLDTNFQQQNEYVTLQGQTFVQLTGTYTRIFRAYVYDSTEPSGTIYISSNNTDAGGDGIPDVTTAIHATIPVGENQTLQCPYTIPSDYEGFLIMLRMNVLPVSGATVKAAKFQIDVRPFGSVWRTQFSAGLTTSGTSMVQLRNVIPGAIPPKADIRFRAYGIGASVDVDAGYSIALLEP